MNFIRRGCGKALLLVHGLGGSWHSWEPILDSLSHYREITAVDLPGFGNSAPLSQPVSRKNLADALASFIQQEGLAGAGAVGCGLGASLILELARRGDLGPVVALDPDGFWTPSQARHFHWIKRAHYRAVKMLRPWIPQLVRSPLGRTLLLLPLAADPCRVNEKIARQELASLARGRSFENCLTDLVHGENFPRTHAGSFTHPVVIGWGNQDRTCPSSAAQLALDHYPDAQFYGFDRCGHYPHWENPSELLHLILSATGERCTDPLSFKQRGVEIPRRLETHRSLKPVAGWEVGSKPQPAASFYGATTLQG